MDIWEAMERSAVSVLEREVANTPPDREALEKALHLFAIGKNKDPHIPASPLDILGDADLANLVNALLSGNQIGA
jgi:hypothetical protein